MLRILEARGASCNVPEKNPGKFCRLFGGDEMIITLEYLDKPANVEVFNQALTSPVTKIVTPDIGERLTRHRSHVLIEVAHGVLGVYELEPLLHREFGFQSDAYVPRERAFDDRTPPPDLMPRGDDARMVLDNEWREMFSQIDRHSPVPTQTWYRKWCVFVLDRWLDRLTVRPHE